MHRRSRTSKITLGLVFGLASLLLIGAKASFAQVPQVQHVIIVAEENAAYADLRGPNSTSSMPLSCGHEIQGSFADHYYAPTHRCIGNHNDLGLCVVTTNHDG